MRGCLLAALVAVGCSKPPADQPGHCLPLSVASRSSLTAAPDGGALYWLEAPRDIDFDAVAIENWRLVRFDLRTRQTHVLLDHAAPPLRWFQGHLIALRSGESYRVVLIDDDHVQELTPDFLDILDLEVLDRHRLALLGDGRGARAIYLLDINEPRPEPLIDAEVLLTTSAGRIYARTGDDDGFAIDPDTGAKQTFPLRRRGRPLADTFLFVDRDLVMSHNMRTGEVKTVIATPGPWKLLYQDDSILARTPPKQQHERSQAWLVTRDGAQRLPTVIGGASIVGTAAIGTHTWALIGHNTTNYRGDLADTDHETDVCLLPDTGDVTFPTRQFPARYVDIGGRLYETVVGATKSGGMQIIDGFGSPTELYVRAKGEFAARDLALIRERTQSLHRLIVPILRDREVRLDFEFGDKRHGVHRWRRDRLGYRTTAGMGDALLSDPADFSVEVSEVVNEKKDDKITCTGKLRNLQAKPAKVVLQCSGNRKHTIDLGELAPDETKSFSQTFEVSEDGEVAFVEAIVDGKRTEPRELEAEARAQAVFELATDVYAATSLALSRHDVGDGITVELEAEPELLREDRAAQDKAIMTAYERYAGLRAIYHVDDKSPMRLKVSVELSDVSFSYDGTKLLRDD